jgi:AcrR family transcriptional regulator
MSTYHHGNLRPAVLRAAGKMLEKHGLASLSVREVARRAKVSHNAPYRHFPDRESLLASLAAEGFERLGEALSKVPANRMGEAYVSFALQNPERFRLMFGGRISPEKYPELKSRAAAAFGEVEKSFGGLGGDAPRAAAAAWSLVHGLSHLILDGHFAAEQAAAGGFAPFVNGVVGGVRFAVRAQRSA